MKIAHIFRPAASPSDSESARAGRSRSPVRFSARQSEVALESAQKLADNVRLEQIEQFPTIEFFKTVPVLAHVQFGKWNEILAMDAPPAQLDYSNAIHHYARGVALARKGEVDGAVAEQAALTALKDSVQVSFMDTNDYPASVLLNIADSLLLGEIAMAGGEPAEAVSHFETAVALQDGLPYTEPPFWYYPTRQSLGKALMEGGRFAEAEAVYRKDLADYPHNGWSMYGLAAALEAQGKTAEAAEAAMMFEHAWSNADIELTSSRL